MSKQVSDAEALAWIRKKLNLPPETRMFDGYPTIAGTLHVLCAHAYGYEAYVRAYRCDDKQGEIARLTAALEHARMEIQRLNDPSALYTKQEVKLTEDNTEQKNKI